MTLPARYPIPAQTCRVEIVVTRSRFIATIGPAETVEGAKTFIASIRAEMPDATHHVFAYRVGYGGSVIEGMSDDSEPSGTAGRPALAVLRGEDVGDVALVITRYFGGAKLGKGGLVRAYTEAAQAALAALPRTARVQQRIGLVVMPYSLYEAVKRSISDQGGEITGEDFGGEVSVRVSFPADCTDNFENALADLSAGRLSIVWE